MRRFLLPIILLAVSAVLFALYTDPTYQASKALSAEVAAYDDALSKSQELRRLRDELVARRNTFATDQLTRLQRMLPDNVDNIRLIIDINGIAARHGLTLSNVALGEISNASKERSNLAVGDSGDPIDSVTLGFTLFATYDELLVFLQDIEHSLRLIDIESLEFDVNDEEPENGYTFSIRTYWLH
jgi:Tfp pilus assembly protein PilO